MYYILSHEVFESLPEEAQESIKASAPYIEDEDDVARVENIAGIENDADLGDKITFGEEDEFEADTDSEGKLKMAESEKNNISSFGDASKRGMGYITSLAGKEAPAKEEKKPSKIKKIPKDETVDDESV